MLQINRAAIYLGVFLVLTAQGMGRAGAANPYAMGPVRFFASPEKSGNGDQAIEWGEASIDAQGLVTYRMPPGPVLEFLTDPTPQKARAYLAWQHRRTEQVLKAQRMLAKMEREGV